MFWIWFVICFACFAIRTLYNYVNHRGCKISSKKPMITTIYIVMGVLWFSWFQMNFIDPVKISLPLWLRMLGLLFFIIGVSFFLFAHAGMRRLRNEGQLVTSGIYSKIRNPMYLGFILWVVGFPVFLQSILTLTSAFLWIPYFLIWKILEERDLQRRISGYHEYRSRTWF